MRIIGLVSILTATGALAEGPPPEFLAGKYQLFSPNAPGAVALHLRLDPFGDGMSVTLCGMEDGGFLALPAVDDEHGYVSGQIGDWKVQCDPFTGYDNYPFIACIGEAHERLMLWPEDDFGATLDCDG